MDTRGERMEGMGEKGKMEYSQSMILWQICMVTGDY